MTSLYSYYCFIRSLLYLCEMFMTVFSVPGGAAGTPRLARSIRNRPRPNSSTSSTAQCILSLSIFLFGVTSKYSTVLN